MRKTKRLITINDVISTEHFLMPKAFFKCPDYQQMKNESKVAYMLMLDLLPTSVENKWANKHDEVYVKLSRSRLMELLNIKGTQKAAQIMKELSAYGLIFYKRVGLSKCNEIYLYPPTGGLPLSQMVSEDEIAKDDASKMAEDFSF